jgi:hypothetical protein
VEKLSGWLVEEKRYQIQLEIWLEIPVPIVEEMTDQVRVVGKMIDRSKLEILEEISVHLEEERLDQINLKNELAETFVGALEGIGNQFKLEESEKIFDRFDEEKDAQVEPEGLLRIFDHSEEKSDQIKNGELTKIFVHMTNDTLMMPLLRFEMKSKPR